jgi:hypothetical protein
MPAQNLAIDLSFPLFLISSIIRFLKKLWPNKGGGTFTQVLYCALLACCAHIEMHRALISRGADANSMTWEEIEAAARMQVSLFVDRFYVALGSGCTIARHSSIVLCLRHLCCAVCFLTS